MNFLDYNSSQFIISCEHASSEVPVFVRDSFAASAQTLRSHRGFDFGAAPIAAYIAKELGRRVHAGSYSRLVIDLNRSPQHPSLFSKFMRNASMATRQRLMEDYYIPHRWKITEEIDKLSVHHRPVIHLAVHSFTPVRNGEERRADIGLLYDPARKSETLFVDRLANNMALEGTGLRIRRNYPYRGVSDGLTKFLRSRFAGARYAGIEIEVNQRLIKNKGVNWASEFIMKAIQACLGKGG